MIQPEKIKTLKTLIEKHRRFVLTTHVNPDGDGLGSEIALYHYLKGLGKEVRIWNHNPVPENYTFLDPTGAMEIFGEKRHQKYLAEIEVVFVLDISDWFRLKSFGKWLQKQKGLPIVCIDHHPNGDRFGSLDFLMTKASSTGEIVFEILKALNASITLPIAEALYTAILTDTGSFRFNNTTARAHRIVAELMDNGIHFREIYEKIYENERPEKMKLLGMVLQELHFESNGRIVWFRITQEMLQTVGLKPEDIDGFSDFPRRIAGVEISLMFVQIGEKRTKVSFRSKGNVVINRLAQEVGGGGHPFASGAMISRPLWETIDLILPKAVGLFA